MPTKLLTVDGYVPTLDDTFNLRHEAWSFALDQRAFGPRKLLVAFAAADGRFLGVAFTDRTEPIDDALGACLTFLGQGATAAIAFNDEPVEKEAPADAYFAYFRQMQEFARRWGIRLVDWFACDDHLFRSLSPLAAGSDKWWSG